MAITKRKTYEQVAAQILADKAYRSVTEVTRDLDKINDQVTDSLNLLKTFQKNIEKAAGVGMLTIDVDRPSPKDSPIGKKTVKPQLVKNLEKNFLVIQYLYEAKASLETLEAKLRASNKALGVDLSEGLTGVAAVRKKVFKGLDDAFTFLRDEAARTMPDQFAAFIDKMRLLVSRSITYEDSVTYSYMFVNGENLCYSSYIQLKDITDDKGSRLPELYIVVSMEVSAKDSNKTKHYLDVMYEFEPPSASLLTSSIDPGKMASVAQDLADLLNVTHFANSIQRIPINLLIAPEMVTRDLFSYSKYVQTVDVSSETQQINFWLKPDVTDKVLIDDILKQLYLDLKGLATATRGKLRPSVTEKKNKSGAKCQVVSFFCIRGSDAPAAGPEDIEFLKERFSLSDKAMTEILRTINKD